MTSARGPGRSSSNDMAFQPSNGYHMGVPPMASSSSPYSYLPNGQGASTLQPGISNAALPVPYSPPSGLSSARGEGPKSARGDTPNSSRGSNVKVFVRVRPFLGRERVPSRDFPQVRSVVEMQPTVATLLDPADEFSRREGYKFDRCFWSCDAPSDMKQDSQSDVYGYVSQDLLDNMFNGYNTCMFCYGQTGSGKTYNMMGNLEDRNERGIIPRLCEDMFWRIQQEVQRQPGLSVLVEANYCEIYNEKVRDLLAPKMVSSTPNSTTSELKVRNHPDKGPFIDGLSSHVVGDLASIFFLMKKGSEERTTASTAMNDQSSRSHAIFTITLTQKAANAALGRKVCKVHLVDLAGSERTSAGTDSSGRHFKESTSINLSLTILGRVIDALANRSRNGSNIVPPYRDSTLTWLLSDSLGGNSKTFMMATISPAPCNFEETLSTLRYSSRARRIINNATVNVENESPVIKELREEITALRAQLQLAGHGGDVASVNALQKRLHESEREAGLLRSQLGGLTHRAAVTPELQDENRRLKEQLEKERKDNQQRMVDMMDQMMKNGLASARSETSSVYGQSGTWTNQFTGRPVVTNGGYMGGTMTMGSRRPYFGIEIDLETDGMARGVSILATHGPAVAAGLRAGDVITMVADHPVANRDELKAVLLKALPGDSIHIGVMRGGQFQKSTLIAGEVPTQEARMATPQAGSLTRTMVPTYTENSRTPQHTTPRRQADTLTKKAAYSPYSPYSPGTMDQQGRKILSVSERTYYMDDDGNISDKPLSYD